MMYQNLVAPRTQHPVGAVLCNCAVASARFREYGLFSAADGENRVAARQFQLARLTGLASRSPGLLAQLLAYWRGQCTYV